MMAIHPKYRHFIFIINISYMIILKDKNKNSIINIIRGTKYINGSNECNCNLNMLDSSVTSNGVHTFIANDFGADGFSEVSIDVDVPIPTFETENKDIIITENGTTTVTPSAGYDGMTEVNINVDVQGNSFNFDAIGYSSEDIQQVNKYIEEDIAYGEMIKENYTIGIDYADLYNFKDDTKLVYFPYVDLSVRTTLYGMFEGCQWLQYVPPLTISNKCTSLDRTFIGCKKLQNIDVSYWNISNVTSLYKTFYGCTSLKEIVGIENWSVSNVTDANGLFYNCNSLTTLDLSTWNANKITDTTEMFYNCNKLQNIDLSGWTANIKWMRGMFSNCYGLKNLNMSNIDVSNVKDFEYAFLECIELTNFQAPKNINAFIDLYSCSLLTVDSLLSVLNNLVDRTNTTSMTCKLGDNLSKLTEDQIAIATNKNWILQY